MLTARTVKHNNKNSHPRHLLGGEVKVESRLKSVKFELTRWEKVPWSRGAVDSKRLLDRLSRLLEGRLLNWSWASRGGCSELLNIGLVTCEQTSLLVRGIKGVDERVDSSAISTSGDTVYKVSVVVLGSKVSSISIELEVTVSGVMRVDEWVVIGVNWLISIVIVNCLNYRSWSSLMDRSSNLDRSRNLDRSLCNKGCRFLTSCSSGNVSSFQDLESVYSCSVSDADGLAIIINVTVLSDPLSISS